MKRGKPGDLIVEITTMRTNRTVRVVCMVWSHKFYLRPHKRQPDPAIYHWGVWWLWFYIGSLRSTRSQRDRAVRRRDA